MTRSAIAEARAAGRRLSELATMAREMAAPGDLGRTLDVVLAQAQRAFLCDAVGILLVRDGQIVTAATSEPDVDRADELQIACGQGPCLEALHRQQSYRSDDLGTDVRWPSWGPRAAELGWRSILSVGLAGADKAFGALNLYSRRLAFFRPDDLVLGEIFCAQAAVALAGAQERDSLVKAVEARHLIGQAQGILMERYSIDAEQAFTVLRRYSSHLNRKLRLVAEDVVAHRNLPDS